jgi:hypothetical protein
LQILCDVHGGLTWDGIASGIEEFIAEKDREIRAVFEQRPDTIFVGGRIKSYLPSLNLPGIDAPDGRIFGILTEFGGKPRYVYANIEFGSVGFIGLYAYTAEDVAAAESARQTASATPVQPGTGPAVAMRSVAEICLRNYRTPDAAPPALEAAGMTLSPMEGETFEISGPDVWGIVTAGTELYCTVQSTEVPLEIAQEIGGDLAHALFPDLVQPGAPEGGQGPCDGYSIFAPRQLIWLHYAQAGNSGECINDGTSAIIIH